jgi:hypothetical protein
MPIVDCYLEGGVHYSKLTKKDVVDYGLAGTQVGADLLKGGGGFTVVPVHAASESPLVSFVDSAGLHQFGACPGCNKRLVSWSKRAECPFCGEDVRLT